MQAFAAFLWDETDSQAEDLATEYVGAIQNGEFAPTSSLHFSGCRIFDLSKQDANSRLLPIKGTNGKTEGAVFGNVFRNSSDLVPRGPVEEFRQTETEALINSRGKTIISDFWGNYVSFFNSPKYCSIIASPTSAVPCYFAIDRGVIVAFSHLEKCNIARQLGLTIDYDFISKLIVYDKIQNGQTGFTQICELIGGQQVVMSDRRATIETIWDPREIAADKYCPRLGNAASDLRDTTRYVVQSWASAFKKVSVNLSGGLDSSIVLACLGSDGGPRNFNAIHHIVDSDDASELHYARAVSEFIGCELIELEFKPDFGLPSIESHPLCVRPYRQFLAPDFSSMFGPALSKIDGTIFTGQGGDHLFEVSKTSLGFADFIHDNGVSVQSFSELMNAARLSNRSIWEVVRRCIFPILSGNHKSALIAGIEKNRTPFSKYAHELVNPHECVPDWAKESHGLPPAKFDQVSRLMHLFLIRETLDQPVVGKFMHPLISQPLIELCLRMPIYLLCTGGVSRGLARHAFKGEIPEVVRTRMTKGESTRYFVDQITSSLGAIKSAVVGGQLSSRGLIPQEEVANFTTIEQLQTHKLGRRLLIYYAIEAWLRNWNVALADPL